MGYYSLSLSQFLTSILFLFHFHTTISSSNYSSCAHDQSLSLLQFKESFSINSSASWHCQHPKTESWKESSDCCLWDGVTCGMKTGQVIGLNLTCSMLYGTLHTNSTLFSLHHLQKLDLSDNDFNSSHISSQFGQFSNLTHLNLSFSGFAGQVPSEISHLSKLVSLDLSGNYYPSLEPISFDKLVRNLTKLRELDLSWVDMSLVVPNSLMNLSSYLSSLKLVSCGLQGKFPSSMGKLKHLQYLNLRNNSFTGSIPYDFEQLTELVSLDLSENHLSLEPISFDKLVRNLTKLRELDLSFVAMSLVVPNSLMNLSSSLSSLILYSCGLQGKFPSSIGKLKNLQYLDLRYNNFTGSIPYDFEQLSELVSIDLSFNSYLSVEPISFEKIVQNLTKLRGLRLGYVNMSLIVPNSLMNLSSSLSALSLWGCGLHGKFPGNIFLLPNLVSLDLTYNDGLTGSFPSSNVSNVLRLLGLSHTRILVYLENDFFTNLKLLEVLALRNSNIIRSNLTLLGHLTQLTRLDLSTNYLGGQIPSSLGNLVQLRSLNLDSNNFFGRIPDFLGNLNQLETLDLSNNQLVGSIHSQISTISLKYFDLSKNQLHGPIPNSIFKQENLEALILASNNKLTGEISSSICKLKFLRVLDLSNNSLGGFIPQCLGNFSNALSVLHLGMNNLQGTIFSTFSKGNILDIST